MNSRWSPSWTRTIWRQPWRLTLLIYVGRGAPKNRQDSTSPAQAPRAPRPRRPSPRRAATPPPRATPPAPRAAAVPPPRRRLPPPLPLAPCWIKGQGDIHGGDLLRRRGSAAGFCPPLRSNLTGDRGSAAGSSPTRSSSSTYSSAPRRSCCCTVRVDTGGGVARATLVRGIIHLLAIRYV